MWAAQLLEETQHMSLILFPCPAYKQRKWSDTLDFLWKQKEAKMCWIWSFTSYLASLPFLCSRRRWREASLICRDGSIKCSCRDAAHTPLPAQGEGRTGSSRVKEAHVPKSQLHTEQQSPGQAMLRSPPPGLRSTRHFWGSQHEKTPLSLHPGSGHVRFEYLLPDVSTPAPLWSAHLTHGRTDVPELLPCNEPHELLKPLWRGEQNLSTADEIESFASQRGHFALSEKVALDKALFPQNSSASEMFSAVSCKCCVSASLFNQLLNFYLFFPLQPFFKKYLCTLKINKLIWEHWWYMAILSQRKNCSAWGSCHSLTEFSCSLREASNK